MRADTTEARDILDGKRPFYERGRRLAREAWRSGDIREAGGNRSYLREIRLAIGLSDRGGREFIAGLADQLRAIELMEDMER